MAAISDAFTIGMILLLIFGAISFYLYTRIQQGEKRLSLCENILLDLKVSAEHGVHNNLDFMTVPESAETQLYESAINAAYTPQEEYQETTDITTMDDIMVEKVDEPIENEDIDVSLYDALTVKELKNLAKNNHVSGASSMSRTQLIDALSKAKIVPSMTNELPNNATSASAFGETSAVSFD